MAMTVFAPRVRAQKVILISIDTLRADHLHCYGYRLKTSPNLDRLAREGVRFTDAYTTIPLMLPAHAAITMGQSPARGVCPYLVSSHGRGRAKSFRSSAVASWISISVDGGAASASGPVPRAMPRRSSTALRTNAEF